MPPFPFEPFAPLPHSKSFFYVTSLESIHHTVIFSQAMLVSSFLCCGFYGADNNVSESSMMPYSTYNYLVFVVSFAVLMISKQSESSFVLGNIVLGCFATCFLMSVLIFPKMYIHFTGKVLNVHAMFGVGNGSNSNSNDEEQSERSVSIPAPPRIRRPVRVWDTVTEPDNETMQFKPSYAYGPVSEGSKSSKNSFDGNGNSSDGKSGWVGSHHSNNSGGSSHGVGGARSLRTTPGEVDGDSLQLQQSGAPSDRVMPFSVGPELLNQDTQDDDDPGGTAGVELFAARSTKNFTSTRSKPGPLTIDEVEELSLET